MTITRDDLEKVCNYSENSKPSLPQGMIAYLDMVEEPNDEYKWNSSIKWSSIR